MATGKLYENGVGWRDFAATDIPASGVTAGTYGDGTHVAQVTVAASGLVTAASSVLITGGGGGGGGELDYVEATGGDLSITGTSAASPTTAITGNAITLNGSTDILVEFYCYFAHVTGNGVLVVDLWDGSTNIGRMGGCDIFGDGSATSNTLDCKVFLRGSRRPTSASHTYAVKIWKSGTASIGGGAGGNDVGVPYWYRVTTL